MKSILTALVLGVTLLLASGAGFSWMDFGCVAVFICVHVYSINKVNLYHCFRLQPITMAFSLPLSKAASKLGSRRPTSSILGAHTVSSACGVLVIHFFFLVMAFVLLYQQDWFQCRKWDGEDISLEYGLGDNYDVSQVHVLSSLKPLPTNHSLPYLCL